MMFLVTEILIQVIRYLYLKLICGLQNVTNDKKIYITNIVDEFSLVLRRFYKITNNIKITSFKTKISSQR